jgi:hypothetical protein
MYTFFQCSVQNSLLVKLKSIKQCSVFKCSFRRHNIMKNYTRQKCKMPTTPHSAQRHSVERCCSVLFCGIILCWLSFCWFWGIFLYFVILHVLFCSVCPVCSVCPSMLSMPFCYWAFCKVLCLWKPLCLGFFYHFVILCGFILRGANLLNVILLFGMAPIARVDLKPLFDHSSTPALAYFIKTQRYL